MIGNTAVDCSLGIEGDNPSSVSTTTLIEGNTLTCVYGNGYNAPNNETYLTGGGVLNHDYSTVIVTDNTVSGSAPGSGYCAYNVGNGVVMVHSAYYTNNQCINGCTWR